MKELFSGIRHHIVVLLEKKPLKFNDIKKELHLKSNELSYHLKKLKLKEIISLENEIYSLSSTGKNIFPYIPIFLDEQTPVFTVVSVALCEDDKSVYLHKKPREPDKDILCLYGSKALSNKTLDESAVHYAKEQAGINIKNLKLRCINEYIKSQDGINHHWIVYFYTATPLSKPNGTKVQLKEIDSMTLYGDNNFLLKNMISSETVQSTRTIYKE